MLFKDPQYIIPNPNSKHFETTPLTVASLNHLYGTVYKLTAVESVGYSILAFYASYFAAVFSEELKQSFKFQTQYDVVKNEKSGQNPSTDACVIMLLDLEVGYCIPVVMYEYKPIVHSDRTRVDVSAMIEMLLQAHYCMRHHKIELVLHCLTDLKSWYYFKLQFNKVTSKLAIIWWCKIEHKGELSGNEVENHAKFLLDGIRDEVRAFVSDISEPD